MKLRLRCLRLRNRAGAGGGRGFVDACPWPGLPSAIQSAILALIVATESEAKQ